MNKRKGIRRLIALGSMSAFTLASFVTTTFAFVTLNTEATVSGFTFNITDQKGLLLSVDGDTFYQDIDSDLIKATILKNQNYGLDPNVANYKTNFSQISFEGITLGGKAQATDPLTAGIYSEEYEYKIGNYIVPIKDKKATFVKDSLYKYSSQDLDDIDASTDPQYTAEYKAKMRENDNFYGHAYKEAGWQDYVFFDLWAMVADDTQSGKDFDLKFSSRTEITGKEEEVTLLNNMTTTGAEDLRTGSRTDGRAYVNGQYVAQDTIKVNPADAMRLGVVTLDNSINAQNIGENNGERDTNVTNLKVNVFEVNQGLGSYAVAGQTDTTAQDYKAARNPELNAMYTYYNSLFPLSPFTKGVDDNGQLNTKSTYTDTVLGTFTYNNTTKGYNVVKLSVMVWLEGWDADYFAGIKDATVAVKLGFEIVEKN